jgi:hypothetical protein
MNYFNEATNDHISKVKLRRGRTKVKKVLSSTSLDQGDFSSSDRLTILEEDLAFKKNLYLNYIGEKNDILAEGHKISGIVSDKFCPAGPVDGIIIHNCSPKLNYDLNHASGGVVESDSLVYLANIAVVKDDASIELIKKRTVKKYRGYWGMYDMNIDTINIDGFSLRSGSRKIFTLKKGREYTIAIARVYSGKTYDEWVASSRGVSKNNN